MADYKDRFILNPIKMVWFSLSVCVDERQRTRIMVAECRRSLCPLFKNISPCPWHMDWTLIKKHVEDGG